ncbi:HET-domain-containing protein [Dothidotthia symphoricarpi CBS 119687]|uniref:HET-domain-containing protein n=1 Tax=Dothidotthia symphoricarpi CBS 119687 TaxID=1392245 RepID=A0A6A6AAD1_9PLEO|nr:HET-domain-containing protein [Dothidotthia symphoricarpi CBS 119687]KAF2128115.1 HET-domain-containing protein [Dothidotthia symphoricarpi CBS 119687]
MVSVCATCKGLQKHLNTQESEVGSLRWVSTSLPNLRASAANNRCRACALLLQGILLHHDRFANIREDRIQIMAESFNPRPGRTLQDHLSVEIRWKQLDHDEGECQAGNHEHTGNPDLKLEFFTDGAGQSSFSAIGRGRNVSDNPLQAAGLQATRDLINNCVSSHSTCRQSHTTSLPKRVLDVSMKEGSKSIRLHSSHFNEEEQRYESGKYIALSHVWGLGRGIPKTTTKSLQSQTNTIPWSTLPRTYQEAIVLTRALGFRWLFIDSLCLVQDDVPTKLEDSIRMDEIYGNAFLTIAATSATDSGSHPLFPPKTQPFKIQATDDKGSLFKIYVREQPSHYSFKAPFDDDAHMNDWELPFNTSKEANLHTPLLKRAWAYTERLLSPRVLHFTKSEMILECRQTYQCECGRIEDATFDARATDSIKQEFARLVMETKIQTAELNGNSNGNGIEKRIDSMATQLATTSLNNDSQDAWRRREEGIQLWSYIVTEFTARNMTYDYDRLIAIANIAKPLLPTIQSGYVVGQWTSSTLGLLWYPSDSTRCRRPKGLTGQNVPSWSWASLQGSPVFFDNASAMDLACRASFGSKKERTAVWSPLSGHIVELTAAMATEVTFASSCEDSQDDDSPSYSLLKNGIAVDFTPDINPPRGEDTINDGDKLVCVLVSMTFRSSIIGLVLKPVQNNTYRRVGRFECYECTKEEEEEDDEMSEDAEALFEHWFPEIQDMTQLDEYPQRRFTIV